MKFRTNIKGLPIGLSISHGNSILTLGSCFSEEVGKKLRESRFDILSNPFGTIFNPRIFEKIFQLGLNAENVDLEETLFEKDGLWFSYWFHSRVNAASKSELTQLIIKQAEKSIATLKQVPTLILTLGTAKVYFSGSSQKEVGNCHKMPAKEFEDRMLTIEEITSSLQNGISLLQNKFKDLRVIITVSPIRHLKDGMVSNQRSKARLVLAAEKLCSELSIAHYFPAYEIVLDDLRDYRFYAEDLLHPNQLGIDYVWEKFQSTYFDEQTMEKIKRIKSIVSGLNHAPFNKNSPQYREFLKTLLIEAEHQNIANLMTQEINDLKIRIENF